MDIKHERGLIVFFKLFFEYCLGLSIIMLLSNSILNLFNIEHEINLYTLLVFSVGWSITNINRYKTKTYKKISSEQFNINVLEKILIKKHFRIIEKTRITMLFKPPIIKKISILWEKNISIEVDIVTNELTLEGSSSHIDLIIESIYKNKR